MKKKGNNKSKDGICSFCGDEIDKRKLITGPDDVAICESCVSTCNTILGLTVRGATNNVQVFDKDAPLPTPKEINEFLSQYVIGQTDAKKILSVAVYNHYKRIMQFDKKHSKTITSETLDFSESPTLNAKPSVEEEEQEPEVVLDKTNILMLGPTGVGKTELARTLAKKLNVPFAIADATTVTEAGYVGDDVENILLKLIQAADGDVGLAEKGIVYIDEIDKIARKGENTSITRDVSGEGVQQALLKIIEGTECTVPPFGGRKHPNQDLLHINTENILFICGGAFVDIEKIIETRIATQPMGFGANFSIVNEKNREEILKHLHPDDLSHFGLIPELIGRLPITVSLNHLSKEEIIRIILEPKNAILKQYITSLALDNTTLILEDEAIEAIAEETLAQKTGARGIRSIIEPRLVDIMYEIPSILGEKTVTITRDVIKNHSIPKIEQSSATQSKKVKKEVGTVAQ